ncbi:MAG: 50S ribosomal protein L9 [Bacillota bacterium]
MKVVLTEDVRGTGKKGSIVEVAEGYARNYLIPRKLAKPASEGTLKSLHLEKEAASNRIQRLMEDARKTRERIDGAMVTVAAKSGEGGRLFGSVTAQDISDALWKQHRIRLDKKKIVLVENIKAMGLHFVPVKLFHDISTEIRVNVVEERKGETV